MKNKLTEPNCFSRPKGFRGIERMSGSQRNLIIYSHVKHVCLLIPCQGFGITCLPHLQFSFLSEYTPFIINSCHWWSLFCSLSWQRTFQMLPYDPPVFKYIVFNCQLVSFVIFSPQKLSCAQQQSVDSITPIITIFIIPYTLQINYTTTSMGVPTTLIGM